ncbi:MAG: alpha-amylase family glycosyl hydrolase [Candidatus Competibacteraceae bacterium]|jgi:glycosidase|nr:alpha-amylase family glycosyl hydrolase [Candidatus Competibacteraceae bacterium]
MTKPRYPSLYQLNTRVRLTELSRQLGRFATLDDLTDAELDWLADLGFDWLWLLGVWQTGEASRQVSRSNPAWQAEFQSTLPDLQESDICGSCFAITGYTVKAEMGGNTAMERLRTRLKQRGLRLLLDFVPNHMALNHPWVEENPAFFIGGTDDDLAREPHNYTLVNSADGSLILAYGRDPYFAGWPDTVQLNYGNPELQNAMRAELLNNAALCDGIRCDMAMLIEPEVFERTWGIRPEPFWANAIEHVQQQFPDFLFMAEVYWDMEWDLQQHGFHYTYDKRLYDRLRDQHARPVREHLYAGLDFQDKLVRFLENHDEPRAAATFPFAVHRAAAVVTFCNPGLRFFHQGQLEGWQKRISPHLCRGPNEPTNQNVQAFYLRLLDCLQHSALREGDWQLLDCVAVAEGNDSWDGFIASAWREQGRIKLLVVVNYAPSQGQCFVHLPFDDLQGGYYQLVDLLGPARYDREGDRLFSTGLFLDMTPWGYHVFELQKKGIGIS